MKIQIPREISYAIQYSEDHLDTFSCSDTLINAVNACKKPLFYVFFLYSAIFRQDFDPEPNSDRRFEFLGKFDMGCSILIIISIHFLLVYLNKRCKFVYISNCPK